MSFTKFSTLGRVGAAASAFLAPAVAFAQEAAAPAAEAAAAAPVPDKADTAFMFICTLLVFFMIMPGGRRPEYLPISYIEPQRGNGPAFGFDFLSEATRRAGVRTAWHAPADVSPVGAAANLALDLTSPAFGIQEGHVYPDLVHEIFPGTPVVARGYASPSEAPGWGITVDEKRAAAYPPVFGAHERWTATVRTPDGAIGPP